MSIIVAAHGLQYNDIMISANKLFPFLALVLLLGTCTSPSLPLADSIEYAGPPVFSQIGGESYYIDPSTGSDSNDGLSSTSPFASFSPVNSNTVPPGTTVYLKRGEVFKGPLYPGNGEEGNYLKYCAYGSGDKPLILGSSNLDSGGNWLDQGGHLWNWSESFSVDIGQIYFDGGLLLGRKKWSESDLSSQRDFYIDRDTGILTVYSTNDPQVTYTSIEAARTEHIVNFSNSSYVLFENLELKFGGAHGFGGGNTDHIIIQDCDFSYIGGGWLNGAGDTVRYGNGVEFWGNASNHLVQRNTFSEIFDTALTNQNHTNPSSQHNIFYMNNIISNCGLASFEVWNRPSSSTTAHIYFIHNTSYNPGFGWGGKNRVDKNHFHIALFYNEAETEDIIIRGNIFYSSATPTEYDYNLLLLDENPKGWFSQIFLESNLWYVPNAPAFAVKNILFNDLSGFSTATGKGEDGIWNQPLFINAADGNFTLTGGSPGRNFVPKTAFRTTDFLGNPVSEPSTVGAIE